jgi:HlyD family secretion protein
MSKRGSGLKSLVIWLVVVAVVATAAIVVIPKLGGSKKALKYNTEMVTRGTARVTVSVDGVLQVPSAVAVKSNAGGLIVKMNKDVGDKVAKDEVIAYIDPSDLQTAQDQAKANLDAAQASIQQANQTLDLQKKTYQSQLTTAQETLTQANKKLTLALAQAKIQPQLTKNNVADAEAGLASTKTSLEQAKTTLTLAENEAKRQQDLFAKGFVAQKAVDTAQQALVNAQASVANGNQSVSKSENALANAKANAIQDQVVQQQVDAADSAVKQAKIAVNTALANKVMIDMKQEDMTRANASKASSQVAYDNAVKQLGYTTITSPRDGIIMAKYVEEGTIVSGSKSAQGGAGTTLVDIADTSKLQAIVNVDETDISKIKPGMEVEVTVDAYSDPDDIWAGTVTKIAPQTVTAQNVTTVPVTVDIKTVDTRLKPGMNATCDFVVETSAKDVLVVPSVAVKNGKVQVMRNGRPVDVQVEVGVVGDDVTEIKGDTLQEGDEVVISTIDPNKKTSTAAPSGSGRSTSSSPLGGGGMMGGPPPGR